jgi:hypothetical protein
MYYEKLVIMLKSLKTFKVKRMKKIKIISIISLLLLILSFLPAIIIAKPPCYNWEEITDTISGIKPPANSYKPIYDSESEVMLFIDGPNKKIYAYNVTQNSFVELSSPTMPDYVQYGYWQCYDEKNDVVILFGGHYPEIDDPDLLGQNETWAYSFNTNTWFNMNPSISPPPVINAFLSYDSNAGKMLLYGGVSRWTEPITYYTDVWSYDFALNTWINVTPSSGSSPGTRIAYLWSFDPILNKTLLFGGSTNLNLPYWDFQDDMWTYDLESKSWTEITPDIRPSKRIYSNMVYESNSRKTLLYGGVSRWSPDEFLDDLWTFDSQELTWKSIECENNPSARIGFLAFHSKTNKTYLYGGLDSELGEWDDFWSLTYNEKCEKTDYNFLAFTAVLILLGNLIVIVRKRKNT